MSELLTLRLILDYLTKQKDPTQRTASAICMALALDKVDWETALNELLQRNWVAQDGEWAYKITVEGGVGAGSVVGSGTVDAENIAGRDVIQADTVGVVNMPGANFSGAQGVTITGVTFNAPKPLSRDNSSKKHNSNSNNDDEHI